MRIIDADKLKNELASHLAKCMRTHSKDISKLFVGVLDKVDAAPTVQMQSKATGRWLPIKASIYPYGFDVKCSECGCAILGGSKGYNFCPNCGAKMED